MPSKRTLIVIVAVGLLILGATPQSISAAITGNVYNFHAVWFGQNYKVDSAIVLDETVQGDFRISINNITPSDSYEYTYTGLNYHPYGFSPYYDEHNDSVAFQDNKVYFDLDTTDADGDNLTEDYDFDVFPYFSEHNPGSMFFVNPVWSTHNTDWTTAIDDAETQLGVTEITESTGEGSFSFRVAIGIEYDHPDYDYMNGTLIISFSAAYDTDGVLSTWSLQYVTSSSNENHTVVHSVNQSFARGAGAPIDPLVGTSLALIGVAGIGGLIVGVMIAKKYWG
ncbi:MAG: hypothetical protein ACXACG_08110 [Candidatus Thorarchaeota archaeon]|jgi:hypothetical protein